MRNTLTALSYEILKIANREIPRSIFLKEISNLLIDFLKCSELQFLLKIPKNESQFEFVNWTKNNFDYNIISLNDLPQFFQEKEMTHLWESILNNSFDSSTPFFTEKGTFWTINYGNFSIPYRNKMGLATNINSKIKSDYSLLIIPFLYSNERVGLIQCKNIERGVFSSLGTNVFEEFAQTLSAILMNQHTQSLLRERVKELAFLYEMLRITKQKSISLEDILHQIIKLIPSTWQYPEITQARITLNGVEYTNTSIDKCEHKLTSDIVVDNKNYGIIEVIYTKKCPDIDEGAFFYEERNLLNSIANELASVISQKNNENEV